MATEAPPAYDEKTNDAAYCVRITSANNNDVILTTNSKNSDLINSIQKWYLGQTNDKPKNVKVSEEKGFTTIIFDGARKKKNLGWGYWTLQFIDLMRQYNYSLQASGSTGSELVQNHFYEIKK